MTATDEQYIEQIAEAARWHVARDWDVSSYSTDAYNAVKHVLEKYISVVPGERTEENNRMLGVIINDYLGFYLMFVTQDLGGSRLDYCTSRIWDAFDNYIVESIEDPHGMIEEIEPALAYALYPDEIRSELASIGIV